MAGRFLMVRRLLLAPTQRGKQPRAAPTALARDREKTNACGKIAAGSRAVAIAVEKTIAAAAGFRVPDASVQSVQLAFDRNHSGG
jgi:hypothetical protein